MTQNQVTIRVEDEKLDELAHLKEIASEGIFILARLRFFELIFYRTGNFEDRRRMIYWQDKADAFLEGRGISGKKHRYQIKINIEQ